MDSDDSPRRDRPDPSPASPSRAARVNFMVLFAVAVAFAAYVAWPFRVPLFLALVLASVLHGVYEWVVRRLRGRRAPAALLSAFGLLVVIIGPVAAIVGFLAGQLVKGLTFVRDQLGVGSVDELQRGVLSPRAEEWLDRTLAALHMSREQLEGLARNAASSAEQVVQQVLRGSSEVVLHTAIMLIAFYFFLVEGQRIVSFLERMSPLAERHTRDLIEEFRSVSRASILGAALAAMFQGLAATVGFFLTGVPHAIFFGLLTLFASFVPVIGTLLVWVPAVALLWLSGHHVAAPALAVWCVLFVLGAEQVGKPFMMRAILRGGEEMHTGLVFLSLLGGIEMFGLVGLVLGPLAIAFFLAMVRIYDRDFRSGRVIPG